MRSRIPTHARPPKLLARVSMKGGEAESRMVTPLSGWRSWTMQRLLSFFATVNQRDRYDELDGSYVPEAIFLRTMSSTWSYIPGGIGMLLRCQGVCATTGILTGGKKSSLNVPLCVLFHAKPSWNCIM